MASVSHAGGVIEPVSLSSAIDISPARDMEDIAVAEKDGPGPLASAVLIEQVKQAGAANEVRLADENGGVSNAVQTGSLAAGASSLVRVCEVRQPHQ